MSFSNMLEILQEKNKNKIVLIRTGVFYIATGKDAIFLNKQLGLKCVCFKSEICKIGIPEIRIEYYLRKLEKLNIAYIVYHFDNQTEKLIEKYKSEGNYHNEKWKNNNCLLCKGSASYKKQDKYLNAIRKMMEDEIK